MIYSKKILAVMTGLALLFSASGYAQTPSDADRRNGVTSLTVLAPTAQNTPQTSNQPNAEDEIGDLISLMEDDQDSSISASGLAQSDADSAMQTLDKPALDSGTESEATTTAKTEQAAEERTTQPLNRIGRNTVSQLGLSTIGLKALADQPAIINSMLWSQTQMQDAVFLVEQAPFISASKTMRELVHAVITQPALPPEGNEGLIETLVSARLNWLAGSGQSDRLSQMTRLLPDDDRWAEWRQWQVDYDLVRRADDTACAEAQANALQSLDGFWQKANIVCLILVGDRMKASFAADILSDMLSTNAEEDVNFFMLTDLLLGRRDSISLDLDNLSFLHLVLMDAAHEQISRDAFETLPASMIQASSSFRYLESDAAINTSYDSYIRGLITAQQAQTLWRAQGAENQPVEAALAEIDTQIITEDGRISEEGLPSAYLWIGLSERQSADTDLLIMKSFVAEVKARRAYGMLPFYANLITARMASTDSVPEELSDGFEMVRAIYNPQDTTLIASAAKSAQRLLSAGLDDKVSWRQIDDAKALSLLPILRAKGVEIEDQDWMALAKSEAENTDASLSMRYREVSFAAQQALNLASQNGQVGKTILLAAHLIDNADLGWIAPDDIVQIMSALKQIGLYDEADRLANEAIAAHLLRLHLSHVGS